MPSTWKIRKQLAIVCLIAVFGLGIAAERYRQYRKSNVGDVTVERADTEISLTIDGTPFSDWQTPVTLRAGAHQFHATWRDFQVSTTIHVKRGDKSPLNRVSYSLHNGQMHVQRNSHLLDVAPRPEPEVFAIQTATGRFWNTSDDGQTSFTREPGEAEAYTIHWLGPDHKEAFIQSSNGRYLTNRSGPLDTSPGFLGFSEENDWQSVFKIDRIDPDEPWVELSTGQHYVDVGADPKRVRTTRYELFASPNHLIRHAGGSDIPQTVTPPPAITIANDASNSPSVRRFKGHTNVIRAVLFTPDGGHIISGSSDGTIRFWNLASGKQVAAIQAHRPVLSLAISRDGNTLACGMTDAVVKIWKLRHEPEISHYDERILSRDYRGDVLSIAFSPDDRRVAAGGNRQQHTRIWNLLAPNERCKSSTIMGPVTSLVWSRSGSQVLLCIEERQLRWWPTSPRNRSRESRSGKLLIRSGSDPFVVVGSDILDAETEQLVHSFSQRRGVRAVSAQISGRRNLLVTGDVIVNVKREAEPDEFVSAWDLETGRPLAVLRERFGQVGNIAISPNGEDIAYGSGIRETAFIRGKVGTGDYDVRVWRITRDEP